MDDRWIQIARTSSPEETKRCAARLAELVFPGTVVTLEGSLGAGKTHFVQGLAGGLGVVEAVTSPTFNVMAAYLTGRIPLYHFDLYRLESPDDLVDIAFYDYVESDGVACVEWAEKFTTDLPEDRLEIRLCVDGEGTRVLYARTVGEQDEKLLRRWRARLD